MIRRAGEIIARIGKLVRRTDTEVVLSVATDRLNEALRDLLVTEPSADLSVEDPPLEEVMREVFQQGENGAGASATAGAGAASTRAWRCHERPALPPTVGHVLRAYPALLRVGFAEMVAYRAEFLVWILTTNMPLVMMALWNAVAADGPVGRFTQQDLRTYFLATLVVRILTSTWMVWELTMDIRQGRLATRLLRPMHPLIAYSAQHLAAVPLRTLMVSPIIVVLLLSMASHSAVAGVPSPLADPQRLAIVLAALAGAWLLLFLTMVIIGTLAMFVDSALSVFELWLGVHFILSGYLVPIELLPDLLPAWARQLPYVLPFWYSLGFPVETAVGMLDTGAALRALGVQWLYVVGLLVTAMLVWRAGLRRFVAFGA